MRYGRMDRKANVRLRVDISDEARIVSFALIEQMEDSTPDQYMQSIMTWREARIIAHHILEHTSENEETK